MTSINVGLSVALGSGLGTIFAVPDVYISQVLMIMFVYGSIIGFVFHIYQMALSGVRLPFNRR
jgi:hypothetical protein